MDVLPADFGAAALALARWTLETVGMVLVAGVAAAVLVATGLLGIWCMAWVVEWWESRQ